MEYYKYIHILCTKVFGVRLVHLISRNDSLHPTDHLFVTANSELADELRDYINVVLDDEYGLFDRAALVNKYAPHCDWLILHSIQTKQAFRIKKEYLHKIVWRTWGHDNGFHLKPYQPIKNVYKRIVNKAYKKIIRQYALIGIASIVDIIDLESIHGNIDGVKFLYMPYSSGENLPIIMQEKKTAIPKHEGINIMVGHSGNRTDKHLQILNDLEHLKDENINLFLPLSYGEENYISEVQAKAKLLFGEKAFVIRDYMEYSEYVSFVHKMDVIILGASGSAGLGNVALAMHFNKLIVLDEAGVIAKAFEREHLYYLHTSELPVVTYNRLFRHVSFEDSSTDLFSSDPQRSVTQWKQVIEYLDRLH